MPRRKTEKKPAHVELSDAVAELEQVRGTVVDGRVRCRRCGARFVPDGPLDRVCSSTCGEPAPKKPAPPRVPGEPIRRPNRTMIELRCVECGSTFQGNHADRQFCDATCRSRHHRAAAAET